ncbi:MAG: PilZ domain-containing protein [Candidatus Omnitrophota bacterium]
MCADCVDMNGDDKREFLRVDYETPLNFKILKESKLNTKTDITSRNISASGLLFRTPNEASIPALSSIVWIELDSHMMSVCEEIESDLVIYKNGIFGRVVRIAEGEPGKSYDIGVCFLRKKDMTEQEISDLSGTHGM